MERAMSFLNGNYLLFVALISWLAAQVCKTILDFILTGSLDLERMFGAGGMPSAHSALVCSLTIAWCAKVWRFFAIFCLCLCSRRDRDVRRDGGTARSGEQAKVLNRIVDDWMSDEEDEENALRQNGKRLKEKVGHTPLEVLSGALLGILLAMIFPVT